MKHVRAFENSEDRYTIVTNNNEGLIINVEWDHSSDFEYSFRYINNICDSNIKYYTLEEAETALSEIQKHHNKYIFKIIKDSEIDILIDSNKYNL